MKVYQIEKTEGVWEDTWRVIVGTYLSKKKAESELAKLKATVPDCDECPYSDEGQEAPINTTCPHHKPEYNTFPGYAPYYTCENNLDSWNTPSYSLLEFDVDESEDSDAGEWERLGDNATVCSKCGKGLLRQGSLGYGFIVNEFAYCPFCGRAMKVRKS